MARLKGCARGILVIAIVILVAYCWLFWPLYYSQDAITLRVLDRDSGRPIAGAAVAAVWYAQHYGLEATYSLYRGDEGVTNDQGVVRLAGWWRLRRFGDGHLTDQDPVIYVYKPGFRLLFLSNRSAYVPVIGDFDKSGKRIWLPSTPVGAGQIAERFPGWRWRGAKRYCYWNGKSLGLIRAISPGEQADALSFGNYLDVQEMDGAAFHQLWPIWLSGWRQLPQPLRSKVHPPSPVILLMNRKGESQ